MRMSGFSYFRSMFLLVITIFTSSSIGRLTATSGTWRGAWLWIEEEVDQLQQGAKRILNRVVLGPLLTLTLKTHYFGKRAKYLLQNTIPEFVQREKQLLESLVLDLYRKVMDSYQCVCEHYRCGCCGHAEENMILMLNATGCFELSYLVDDYGFGIALTLNGKTICNETVSVRNPPAACLGLPYVTQLPRLCARLTNITVETSSGGMHTCVVVEARIKKVVVAQYELGCMQLESNLVPLYDLDTDGIGDAFGNVLQQPAVLMI